MPHTPYKSTRYADAMPHTIPHTSRAYRTTHYFFRKIVVVVVMLGWIGPALRQNRPCGAFLGHGNTLAA
jgi:hypothetical protein